MQADLDNSGREEDHKYNQSFGGPLTATNPTLKALADQLPLNGGFDDLTYVSMKSIDIYSYTNNENNLANELRQSYPQEDVQSSLRFLPRDSEIEYKAGSHKSGFSAQISNSSAGNSGIGAFFEQKPSEKLLDMLIEKEATETQCDNQQINKQESNVHQLQNQNKNNNQMKARANSSLSRSSNSSQDSQYEGGQANIRTLNNNHGDMQSVDSKGGNQKERVFYIDWIRAMAIVLVILVHALCNSFDASGLDPDDVPQVQQKKDGIIKCLVQIGIPMFFYISGLGATFFRTEDKNFGIFVGEKALRLLVPFIVGIFVFLIPRLYFGQSYEDFTRPNDEIEPNYWEFTKKTLPSIHLKLSWLWYLPALFIDFIICYPLLRWSIRRSQGIKYDPLTDTAIIAHQLVTLAIWGTVCYFLVTKDDYGSIYLVPAVCTLAGVMFAIYSAQLMCSGKEGYRYALLIKLIGPIGSICMNFWKVQTKNQNLYHIFLMINYDAIFFSQGVIDMCYWRKMVKIRKELGDTLLAPFMVGCGLFLYSICSPMNYGGLGQLFFYPLYDDYTLQCLYTTGTWLFVFTIVWVMAHIGNDKFNDTFYKYFTGSALYAYLSHYFWIILLAALVVRPYKLGFPEAFSIMFFGTFVLIYATYWPLNALYELAFPPKEVKAADLEEEGEGEKDLTPEQEAAAAAAAKADALEKGASPDDMEDNIDKQSSASVKMDQNNE